MKTTPKTEDEEPVNRSNSKARARSPPCLYKNAVQKTKDEEPVNGVEAPGARPELIGKTMKKLR